MVEVPGDREAEDIYENRWKDENESIAMFERLRALYCDSNRLVSSNGDRAETFYSSNGQVLSAPPWLSCCQQSSIAMLPRLDQPPAMEITWGRQRHIITVRRSVAPSDPEKPNIFGCGAVEILAL